MTIGVMKHPFYLTAYKGNPYIVFFAEKDGDPMGNAESMNVMLAVARQEGNDMFFVGGDSNNQPFIAYKRDKKK